MRKKIITIIITAAMLFTLFPANALAYTQPNAFWKIQNTWQQVITAEDHQGIISTARQFESLYAGQALNYDICAVMAIRCKYAARSLELLQDYDSATVWLKKELTYINWMNSNGYDYSDAIITLKAQIARMDVNVEMYALASEPADVPYFGAVGEPKVGVITGSPGVTSTDSVESGSLVYVNYGDDMAHWIRYNEIASKKTSQALSGNGVIELAWNMPVGNGVNENAVLNRIASGADDAYILQNINYLGSIQCDVLLRFCAEMNVWTNLPDAAAFKAAFRHVADLVHKNTKNVAMVYSPNDISNITVNYDTYYPGDDCVDWVGCSTYNNSKAGLCASTFASDGSYGYRSDALYGRGVYDNTLAQIRELVEKYGSKKPIMISESGYAHSAGGVDLTAQAAAKVTEFYSYVPMIYPQVKAVFTFDTDVKSSLYKYAFDGNETVKKAYLAAIKSTGAYMSSLADKRYGYTKVSTLNEKMDKINIGVYAVFPSDNAVKCNYFIDNVWYSAPPAAPFKCTIDVSSLSTGMHTIKAIVNCGNYAKTIERQIYKSEDGTIKGSGKF